MFRSLGVLGMVRCSERAMNRWVAPRFQSSRSYDPTGKTGVNFMRHTWCALILMVFLGGVSFGLSGSGYFEDPWVIGSLQEFDEFASDPNYWWGNISLEADIDLGGRTYSRAVIAPDMSNATDSFRGRKFSGEFDGNGHVIRNLTIDTAGASNDFLGLFGWVNHSSRGITNLDMKNFNITGGENSVRIGGLCGYNWEGVISNCNLSGSVRGGDYSGLIGGMCGESYATISDCNLSVSVSGSSSVGGLCGSNSFRPISNCYIDGSVIGGMDVGGLCGVNYQGLISNCYAAGSVRGVNNSMWIGGLCGHNMESSISNCYSTSLVMCGDESEYAGGLCGENMIGSIINCYATGEVSGGDESDYVGGLCGYSWGGSISNCYATGSVTGGDYSLYLGGVCGRNRGTINNCFWDVEMSGVGLAGDDNFGAVGKTTLEMQTLSTFADSGWDFVGEDFNGVGDVWRMCVDGFGYPRFSWEYGRVGDFACGDGVGFEDVVYLCERWLGQTEDGGLMTEDRNRMADIDGDGVVGFGDFGVLAEGWFGD